MQHNHHSAELGDYLKQGRARLDPEALGFHTARRRTPGLRREEVAHLACISATWYTWLEQGRGGTPSAEVLDRVCQALQFSALEREHVFHLAFGRAPAVRYIPATAISYRLQRVLDGMPFSPAMIRNASWDVLAWNTAAAVVLTDYASLAPAGRNILRRIFLDPRVRDAQTDWEGLTQFIVAAFRADATRSGAAEEIKPLVDELCAASDLFATLWRSNEIDAMAEGTKVLNHRDVGMLSLEYSSFAVEGQSDLTMVVYNPTTPEDRHKIGKLLSAVDPAPDSAGIHSSASHSDSRDSE